MGERRVARRLRAEHRGLTPQSSAVRWWARFQRLAASPAMAEAVMRLAAEIDIREVLPVVSVPTLVLHRTGGPALAGRGSEVRGRANPGCTAGRAVRR